MSLLQIHKSESPETKSKHSKLLDKFIEHLQQLDEASSQKAYDLVKYFTIIKKTTKGFDFGDGEPVDDTPICTMDEFKDELKQFPHYKPILKSILKANVLREFRDSRLHIGLLEPMISLNEEILDN